MSSPDRADSERHERLRTLFNTSPDAIVLHDSAGSILDVNGQTIENLGYSREQLLSMDVFDIEVDTPSDDIRALWERLSLGERTTVERRHRRADGSTFPVEVSIRKIELGGQERFLTLTRDITERKESKREIERAHEQLRQIIDLVPDLIFAKNAEGEYLLANETTAEAYGMTPEEVEGSNEAAVIPDIDDSEAFREDDLEVIESGEPKEIPEEELTTAAGETKILRTTKIPYEVSGSGEDAVLGYGRDITDLKTYEQTLERQRDNLEVLNQMVRHDIRNDLQLVLTYAELLEDYVEDDGEEYVRNVLEATRDAIGITRTARDVTDILLQQESDLVPVSLRPVLEDEIDEVQSANDRALVTVEGPIPRVEVLADEMLESVFRNLLTNAIVHNDKTVPEVTVSATATDDVTRIRIADNGPGIPDDLKAQIFEEGETGLDSEGAGLGLYLVQTLVDRYEGDVWVDDNDPEGSLFVVELPLSDAED